MVSCSVVGCKSRSELKIKGITFHAFPVDSEIKRLWVLATGKSNWQPTKYSRFCSRHFESNLLVRKRKRTELFHNAVPTLHILKESHNAGELSFSCCEPPNKKIKLNKKRKLCNDSKCYEADSKFEDEYDVWAKECAHELRQMDTEQQIFATRAITYILREGRLGQLHRNSVQINNKVPDEKTTNDDSSDSPYKFLVICESGAGLNTDSACRTAVRSSSVKSSIKIEHSSPVTTSRKAATSSSSSLSVNTGSSFIVASHKTVAPVGLSSSFVETEPYENKGDLGPSSVVPYQEIAAPNNKLLIKLEPSEDTGSGSQKIATIVCSSSLRVKAESYDDTESRLNKIVEPISSSLSLVKSEPCDEAKSSLHDITASIGSSSSLVKSEQCDDTGLPSLSVSHGIAVPDRIPPSHYDVNTSPSHFLVKSEPNSSPSSPGFTVMCKDEPE